LPDWPVPLSGTVGAMGSPTRGRALIGRRPFGPQRIEAGLLLGQQVTLLATAYGFAGSGEELQRARRPPHERPADKGDVRAALGLQVPADRAITVNVEVSACETAGRDAVARSTARPAQVFTKKVAKGIFVDLWNPQIEPIRGARGASKQQWKRIVC
jgi:hypothetical protein